ncbi:MAG: hypothetical protein BWY86_00191 [Candidatus Aminicenantes bacterium ADurb.Bin508]|nr:MAG: hypothetical protein BWY86_00191 [Candidatus Aminicenantes bacterium ADurb.Bin508]
MDHQVFDHIHVESPVRETSEPFGDEVKGALQILPQGLEGGVEPLDMADGEDLRVILRQDAQLFALFQGRSDRLFHENVLFPLHQMGGDLEMGCRGRGYDEGVGLGEQLFVVVKVRDRKLLPYLFGPFGVRIHNPHKVDLREGLQDAGMMVPEVSDTDNRCFNHSATTVIWDLRAISRHPGKSMKRVSPPSTPKAAAL